MQPMKPSERARLMAERAEVTPEDIAEYESLVANRFVADPELAAAPDPNGARDPNRARLDELHHKLFGTRPETGR